MNTLTLLIVSHKKHIIDPSNKERVFVKGGFSAIKNEFAMHFSEVILCVPVAYKELPSSSEKTYSNNISICPLPFYNNRKEFILNLPRIVKIISNQMKNSDLIYAMGPNDMGLLGLGLAKFFRKPVIASIDTDRAGMVKVGGLNKPINLFKYFFNIFVIYPYIRFLAYHSPVFITGNMFMGNSPNWHQWIKSTHVSSKVPNFIGPEYWYDGRSLNIVFAGRLAPGKNIETLIEAVKLLKKQGVSVLLLIIGEGEIKEELKDKCKQLDFVSFAGYIPNKKLLESRFCNADIFVLPSKEERQGKVLLEAMACSVPVVASNAGGIPSVIKNGENGLLFNPDSPEELSEKLLLIKNNQEIREHLIKNGYKYALEHSLDKEVQKIIHIANDFYDGLFYAVGENTTNS